MELKLTQNAVAMLNVLLNNPRNLYSEAVQSFGGITPVVPYKAPDVIVALELVALIRWLEDTLMERQSDGRFKLPEKGWSGVLGKRSYLRLKEIVKHYEMWGLLTHNCIPYMELVYGLEGKSLESDIVDIAAD